MKKYIADTNFYLRFILHDVESQARKVQESFRKAKSGEISIFFPDEVILEMEFVLRSFYKVSKGNIVASLISLIKLNYVDIENRQLWKEAIVIYRQKNINLIDIFLFLKACNSDSEVLSFDKDFSRLKKYERQNTSTN